MKKIIKQITGTSVGITFTKDERDMYNIKVGYMIDIPDENIKIKKVKKEGNKK